MKITKKCDELQYDEWANAVFWRIKMNEPANGNHEIGHFYSKVCCGKVPKL